MSVNTGVHRWVILASCILLNVLDAGTYLSLGVLYVDILETFDESRARAATVQSVMYGISKSGGVLSGMVIAKLGCRNVSIIGTSCVALGFMISFFANSILYLVLAVGVLSGAGYSILFITPYYIVGQYFEGKMLPIAMSVITLSSAIGAIIYPYIVGRIFQNFTLQGKLLLTSGLALNAVPLTYLWKTQRTSQTQENKPTLRSLGMSLVKNKVFLAFTAGSAIMQSLMDAYVTIFMDIYGDIPLTKDQCVNALMAFNVANLTGIILAGLIKRFWDSKSIPVTTAFALLGTIGVLSLIFVQGYASALCVTAIIGTCYGAMIIYIRTVVVDVVGLDAFAVAMGIVLTLIGLLSNGTGPALGYFRDITGSYTVSLVVTTSFLGLSCVLFTASCILHSHQTRPIHPHTPKDGSEHNDQTVEITRL